MINIDHTTTRWKRNVSYAGFAQTRERIKKSLIAAMPVFGETLLQSVLLCKEIAYLELLPSETEFVSMIVCSTRSFIISLYLSPL